MGSNRENLRTLELDIKQGIKEILEFIKYNPVFRLYNKIKIFNRSQVDTFVKDPKIINS